MQPIFTTFAGIACSAGLFGPYWAVDVTTTQYLVRQPFPIPAHHAAPSFIQTSKHKCCNKFYLCNGVFPGNWCFRFCAPAARERSKKTKEVFLAASRGSGGKSESPRAPFFFCQRFLFWRSKKENAEKIVSPDSTNEKISPPGEARKKV